MPSSEDLWGACLRRGEFGSLLCLGSASVAKSCISLSIKILFEEVFRPEDVIVWTVAVSYLRRRTCRELPLTELYWGELDHRDCDYESGEWNSDYEAQRLKARPMS